MGDQLDNFIKKVDFPDLYRLYRWENDCHTTGFTDILRLESRLGSHAIEGGITPDDICEVVKWSRRDYSRISIPDTCRFSMQGTSHEVVKRLSDIDNIGPTTASKVLRFALPKQWGAIDTRLVRVFGCGDDAHRRHDWLQLRVRQNDVPKWYIPKNQRHWPSEYQTWTRILSCIAGKLPANCPHPEEFEKSGLREGKTWTVADVEMALFAYVTAIVAQD